MVKLTGAQIIVRSLLDQEVDTVFGYPGGAVLNIYDALYDLRDKIRHVLVSHEQGAAHAADGYARVTGKPGVVIATSGPGATNLVTGIATAYLDSIPLVAFTGNVSTDLLGRDSFQEVDITGITMPVTKHNYQIRDAGKLAETIREAFEIACSGRPGPVLIDVPKDMTSALADYRPLGRYRLRETPAPSEQALDQAAQAVREASRPLIYSGGGVISADASDRLSAFANRIHAPVACSAMGLGGIPWDDSRNLGLIGMHGTPVANRASQECDLLIAAGARFSDRVAGNRHRFAPNARILHIDIDGTEFSKNVGADLTVQGDIRAVLDGLLERLPQLSHEEWVRRLLEFKAYNPLPEPMDRIAAHPYDILRALRSVAGEDAIIVTDVGQHQMMTAQYYGFSRPRSFLSSCGLGTMGYGMGAAIGAKTAFPDRPVVLVTGDGSFHMNLNELATAVSEQLGIVVLVMNNSVLGMVRQWQKLFYQGRYSCTSINRKTDFVRLAEAFGGTGFRITKRAEIAGVLAEALKASGPCVVDCVISRDEDVYPIIPPGGTGDDAIFMEEI